jgi:two-component system sensor histidine kinase YesM
MEDHHTIIINAWSNNDEFCITVEDNGCGIDPHTLSRITEQLKDHQYDSKNQGNDSGGSIGLGNVNSRIQMVFGEQYGLSISSRPGRGTKMIIRMPSPSQKAKKVIAE